MFRNEVIIAKIPIEKDGLNRSEVKPIETGAGVRAG
jgi:hypothetical protein